MTEVTRSEADVTYPEAWEAARKIVSKKQKAAPAPGFELGWMKGWAELIGPQMRQDITDLTGLPTTRTRFRVLDYDGYIKAELEANSGMLEGAGADLARVEIGERIGKKAVSILSEYEPESDEVRFIAPNVFAAAGPNRDMREAMTYLLVGHEKLHRTVLHGVGWLRPYYEALTELSSPLITDERRAELRQQAPSPYIASLKSPGMAESALGALNKMNEGNSEVVSWLLMERGVKREFLSREAALSVLETRECLLEAGGGTATSRDGALALIDTVERKRLGHLWNSPMTPDEVASRVRRSKEKIAYKGARRRAPSASR